MDFDDLEAQGDDSSYSDSSNEDCLVSEPCCGDGRSLKTQKKSCSPSCIRVSLFASVLFFFGSSASGYVLRHYIRDIINHNTPSVSVPQELSSDLLFESAQNLTAPFFNFSSGHSFEWIPKISFDRSGELIPTAALTAAFDITLGWTHERIKETIANNKDLIIRLLGEEPHDEKDFNDDYSLSQTVSQMIKEEFKDTTIYNLDLILSYGEEQAQPDQHDQQEPNVAPNDQPSFLHQPVATPNSNIADEDLGLIH